MTPRLRTGPPPGSRQIRAVERATDKDWIDARFREMNTGPVLNCTMKFPFEKANAVIYKAAAVKLGAKGDAGAVFDRNTLRLTATWTGGYLNHSDRRFGLLNTPTPKGTLLFTASPAPGWADPGGHWDAKVAKFTAPLPREWAKYRGMHLNGDRVLFEYTVGKRNVLESRGNPYRRQIHSLRVALEVGAGTTDATRFLCQIASRIPPVWK